MMEVFIITAVVLWTVFAVRSSRKHRCYGDCAKCAAKCKNGGKAKS